MIPPFAYGPRSKAFERVYFGIAALGAILTVTLLLRNGATVEVLGNALGTGTFLCFGYFSRHMRKAAEFVDWRAGRRFDG